MKKRLLTGLLALMMVVTNVPFGGCDTNAVYAAETEITSDAIAFQDPSLVNDNDFYELCVGDNAYTSTGAMDVDGKGLEFEKEWTFLSLDGSGYPIMFYSGYSDAEKAVEDKNKVTFEDAIPVEAFGKYVYRWTAISLLDDAGNPTGKAALKLVRSKYQVTDWGDTDYQTFASNDDNKTVSVFTICNRDAKDGKFDAYVLKNVEIGGKNYTVTAVGDYALDNSAGSTAICSVTLPSTVKKIGKSAFEGAKNLKTISIQGNITSIGRNAFKGINKKAVFKIKASAENYKRIVSLIKRSGVAKTVTFKRVK